MALNDIIAMGGTDRPNVLQSYIAGRQTADQLATNRLQQIAAKQAIQQNEHTLRMSQMPIEMQAKYSADVAKKIVEMRKSADEMTRKKLDYDNEITANTLSGLMMRPPQERAALWPQARAFMAQQGVDIAQAPEQWDDGMAKIMLEGIKGAQDLYKGDNVTAMDRSGNQIPAREDQYGRLTDYEGNVLGSEWTKFTKSVQDTAAGMGLTKSAQTEVEKDLKAALSTRDKLTAAFNFASKNQDLFDAGSKLSVSLGNAMEFVGVDAPETFRNEVQRMTQLDSYTKNLMNDIRAEVTGAAASYKELDQHIAPLIRKGMDGKTAAMARFRGLVDFNDKTVVRLNMLRQRGFDVVSKRGDQDAKVKTPDGRIVNIESAMPLTAVPSLTERRAQLLGELSKGVLPSQLSKEQRMELVNQANQILEKEGYNYSISRSGWNQ